MHSEAAEMHYTTVRVLIAILLVDDLEDSDQGVSLLENVQKQSDE